jgi:excisionase family DNA binding protein
MPEKLDASSWLEGRVTFRVREVVERTGLAQSTIYEMMNDGTLPNTKVRGIRLIFADGLRQLLNQPPPPPKGHGRRIARGKASTNQGETNDA